MGSMLFCSNAYVLTYPGKDINWKNPIVLMLLLIYSIVIGCRYGVGGVDYFHYLEDYGLYKNYTSFNSSEFLFDLYSKTLSQNNFHYTIYFGIIAFVQMLFLVLAYKKHPQILPYAIVFFFIGSYYLGWCNVLRQNIVVAILLCSIRWVEERKWYLFYLFVIISFFIHSSSIILLLIYPILILTKKVFPNTQFQYLLFFLCVFMGYIMDLFSVIISNPLIAIFFIDTSYSSYFLDEKIATQGLDNFVGIGYFIHILIWCIVIKYSMKMKQFYNDIFFEYCYKLFFVGCCLFTLFPTSIVLQRPVLYLSSFELIIVPFFFYYILKAPVPHYRWRLFLSIFIFMAYTSLFVSEIVNGDITYAKFRFFWNV